ncbi:MAG TPA: FAD-binding oxidoreductase [Thermoplasmata archaeon]|nr:FAD-binding oxidoreductase [Thermoplasmata archaeon]
MGLLRDWNYIEAATEIPALSEMIREALIHALFVRNDRVLPREIIADLTRTPAVTVKIRDDTDVRKLVQVLNGEESTLSLGLPAEDYNYFRTQLGVGKDREIGLSVRPHTLLTYEWLVPEQRGVQLDFSAYTARSFPETGHTVVAQTGAPWKALYDEALAKGHLVPTVPTVPLAFAIGDAVWGDAPLASYDGEFSAYVNALRTISAFGHRTRVGFEEASNNGTGYDILHATLPLAPEFYVPMEVALRLAPRPAATKTLTYAYDDPAKLSAALDKLPRTSLRFPWVHLADATAAAVLRPGIAPDPFTVQVCLAGTASGMPAREKALDAALAGFKLKAGDVPNPYDLPAADYDKAAQRVERSLFVGEIRLPAASAGDLANRLKALGQQVASKVGFYASLRASGTLSAFPFFDHPKDRTHMYDLSKGVARVVEKLPGAVFVSRLGHLWNEDPAYQERMRLFRDIKLRFDSPHVLEPLVRP